MLTVNMTKKELITNLPILMDNNSILSKYYLDPAYGRRYPFTVWARWYGLDTHLVVLVEY